MEMWKNLMLIVVSIAALSILITIASNLLNSEKNIKELKGYKELAIDEILNMVYKCYDRNKGKESSVICYKFKINLYDEISSSDIKQNINEEKISKKRVKCDELGSQGEIIIQYEDGFIYIQKVEYERIGT